MPDAETYVPRFPPYGHQIEALRRLEGQEAFALFMEMRTGKTKVTLDDFGRLELAGKAQDLMVIAPGGVYRTWARAAADHLSSDLLSRAAIQVWESGASATKARRLKAFLEARDRPRIFLVNVEALSSVKAAREASLAFLGARKSVLVVDESTIIKSPSAKRTKFINRDLASLADYRRILSGLPSPKSPLDIYSQFEFLDWRILGFRSFYAFRARYAEMWTADYGGRSVPIVKGFRDLEDLQRRIAPSTFRWLLKDCYDLPPKAYMIREVELTPDQKRIYAEMRDTATAQLSATDHATATVVIAQILRLHQILCGHITDENGVAHEIPENRTRELLSLLEDYAGKAIVWCSYDRDVQKVAAALAEDYGEGSVARFWGGNKSTREAEEARFLKDPECRWMVATAAAGGRGRTWTVADLTVYFSNTADLEHRSQSEERTQGVGKDAPCTYVDLMVPGTVDEKMINALRAKIDLSTAVTGDGYKEWLI